MSGIEVLQIDPGPDAKHVGQLLFEDIRRQTLIGDSWSIKGGLIFIDDRPAGIQKNGEETSRLLHFENRLKSDSRVRSGLLRQNCTSPFHSDCGEEEQNHSE